MATTSLKLPDELKNRIVKIAEARGESPHAFMVGAIATEAQRIEEDQAFLARAEASLQHYQKTGIAYDGDEVMAYFRAKIQGVALPEPQPIKRR